MTHADRAISAGGKPTIFFLHYLGGSGKKWQRVIAQLGNKFCCVTIDLPGFGDASQAKGFTVSDMVEMVAGIIHSAAPNRWLLVGHSMGAKIASAVARRAADGDLRLKGLTGLVLIAGSPPGPEPMEESQRKKMKDWFQGDPATSLREAQSYVDQNVYKPLDTATNEAAVEDVLRANRDAWVAWLDSGSREDWSQKIGVLHWRTLLIAGSEDENLGPDSQTRDMARHFAQVSLVTLPNAKHLLPLEYPNEVAQLIQSHADFAWENPASAIAVSDAYLALIASPRVGGRTRDALLGRLKPDDAAYEPVSLSMTALTTLRAVLARVLPQKQPGSIDIAARIDSQLGAGEGDGWRPAVLPSDAAAYNIGLLVIDEQSRVQHGSIFIELASAEQDDILSRIVSGPAVELNLPLLPSYFNTEQMALWFADLRSDAVQIYVSHPKTLDRIGYSGIANGGDGRPKSGFVKVGTGQKEDWEPLAHPDAAL